MSDTQASGKTLTSRVLRSGTWTLVGFGTSQILRLSSNLIMTRLLVPEMFGVMALAQVFLYMMALISDIGINPSIIRSDRGEDTRFVNTAWTIQVIRGTIICFLVLFIGFALFYAQKRGWFGESSAYSAPVLPAVIMVMSLTSLIRGFRSTKIVLANRKLTLGRLTSIELFSQILGLTVMIFWAYYERTIWALVGGAMVSSLSFVLLSHMVLPGNNNRFGWDNSAFWEIFHFGKWLLLSSVLTAFYVQGDRLLLGGLVTAEIIGIYSIAYFLSSAVKDVLLKINSAVLLPAFSEIHREEKDKLVLIYYRVRRNVDALGMFVAGMLFSSGTAIIELLYDDRYRDAGWMLEVLSLSLIFLAPIVSSSMMLATGRSKYEAMIRILQTSVLFIAFPTLYYLWGMYGAIWALVLVPICAFVLDILYRKKQGMLIFKHEIRMLPLIGAGYLVGIGVKELLLYSGFI